MAFDGIVTKAICEEMQSIVGARVDKVFQPNKNTIILGVYCNGLNYAIESCIDAQFCRINLTTHSKPNPQVAPNFCMLLRKNLIGLKLKNIITFGLERVIILEFEGFDEFEDIISKKLVIELMGKHSNIMLLDDSNVIIDSLRHIKELDENYRNILPHTKYLFPTSDKFDFLDVENYINFKELLYSNFANKENNISLESNNNNLSENNFGKIDNYKNTKLSMKNSQNIFEILNIKNISSAISSTFNGISKNFINAIINKIEITELTDENLEKIYNYINNVINNIGTNHLYFELYQNIKYPEQQNKVENEDKTNNAKQNKVKKIKTDYFLAVSDDEQKTFALNFFIDDFYYQKETNSEFVNHRNTLLRLILDTLKKYEKRLYNIDEKLKECKDMDKYRLYGELITSNLYKIPNVNVDKVEVENYYDNNNPITINLDKKYLPSVNAKRFFKKYSKLKNALEVVTQQKSDTLKDLDYIESVVYELESCTNIDEVLLVYDEISENKIFKDKIEKSESKGKKSKVKKSKLTKNKTVSFNPIKYTVDGYTVLVGRNNNENDYLTTKYANKNDLWFHTKDFHGSHTVLKIDNNLPYPPQEVLVKTAEIAAKHSKARNSSNVPVDYCEIKFVKKPAGSKPGFVTYKNNKTLFVTPK